MPFLNLYYGGVAPLAAQWSASANYAVLGGNRIPPIQSGLALWLRADLGVTLNGSTVSAWADQSGSGNNVSQATGSAQPAFVVSDASFGGRQSLSFASASLQNLVNAGFSLAQPDTIYVAGQITASGAAYELVDGGAARQLVGASAANVFQMYSGTVLNGGASNTSPHVFGAVFNGASSALYVDNSQTANASGAAGALAMTGIEIGGSNSANIQGKIAEVLIYNTAHSPSQRQAVMLYMGQRYGIATS